MPWNSVAVPSQRPAESLGMLADGSPASAEIGSTNRALIVTARTQLPMPNVAASDMPARPALADGADVVGERLDIGVGDRLCSLRHSDIAIVTSPRLEPARMRDNSVT